MLVPLKVKGIDALTYESGEFVLTTIYIPDVDKKCCEVYTSINCELYLVD